MQHTVFDFDTLFAAMLSSTEEFLIRAEVESLDAETKASAAEGGQPMRAESAFRNPTTYVARIPLHYALRMLQRLPKQFCLSGGQDVDDALEGMLGYRRVSVACVILSKVACGVFVVGHTRDDPREIWVYDYVR